MDHVTKQILENIQVALQENRLILTILAEESDIDLSKKIQEKLKQMEEAEKKANSKGKNAGEKRIK